MDVICCYRVNEAGRNPALRGGSLHTLRKLAGLQSKIG